MILQRFQRERNTKELQGFFQEYSIDEHQHCSVCGKPAATLELRRRSVGTNLRAWLLPPDDIGDAFSLHIIYTCQASLVLLYTVDKKYPEYESIYYGCSPAIASQKVIFSHIVPIETKIKYK